MTLRPGPEKTTASPSSAISMTCAWPPVATNIADESASHAPICFPGRTKVGNTPVSRLVRQRKKARPDAARGRPERGGGVCAIRRFSLKIIISLVAPQQRQLMVAGSVVNEIATRSPSLTGAGSLLALARNKFPNAVPKVSSCRVVTTGGGVGAAPVSFDLLLPQADRVRATARTAAALRREP